MGAGPEGAEEHDRRSPPGIAAIDARADAARLRAVLECEDIGVIAGRGDVIIEANDRFLELVGRTRDELEQGRLDWREMTPYHQRPPTDVLSAPLRAGGTRSLFKDFLRPDGTLVPVRLVGGLVEPDSDEWFTLVMDRTEHQRLREVADTEAAIAATMLDSAPVGFALFDADLRVQRINARLAEINGFSVADHLGRNVFDLLPQLRETAEPLLRHVLETGEPLVDVEISGETPAEPGVERHWMESFFAVRREDGEAIGVAAVATDITERKRLERDLREAAAVLDTVLMAAPVGIALLDLEGRYVRINQALADLNGRPADAHIGRPLEEVLAPGPAQAVRRWLAEVVESGQPVLHREVGGVTPSGAYSEVVGHYYPIRSGGELLGVGIAVVDVTERNRLQRAARRTLEERIDLQDTALTELQRMLLPEIPAVEGVEIAARYLAAEAVAMVGGDWYDVFEAPGGRLVVAVGDATGHGLPAVATMDLVRNVLRGQLLVGASLAEALGHASRALSAASTDLASAALVCLDPVSGEVEYALAGHPPPVIHRADGTTEVLPYGPGTLLGPLPGAHGSHHAHLSPGDRLALYTDGMVERRSDRTIDDGIERLARALAANPGIDDVIDQALGGPAEDDACLLIVTKH